MIICKVCGCEGIHACMGSTKDKLAHLINEGAFDELIKVPDTVTTDDEFVAWLNDKVRS